MRCGERSTNFRVCEPTRQSGVASVPQLRDQIGAVLFDEELHESARIEVHDRHSVTDADRSRGLKSKSSRVAEFFRTQSDAAQPLPTGKYGPARPVARRSLLLRSRSASRPRRLARSPEPHHPFWPEQATGSDWLSIRTRVLPSPNCTTDVLSICTIRRLENPRQQKHLKQTKSGDTRRSAALGIVRSVQPGLVDLGKELSRTGLSSSPARTRRVQQRLRAVLSEVRRPRRERDLRRCRRCEGLCGGGGQVGSAPSR